MTAGTFTLNSTITVGKKLTISGVRCALSQSAPSGPCQTVLVGNSAGNDIIQPTVCSAANFVTLANFTIKTATGSTSGSMVDFSCSNANGVPAVAFHVYNVQFVGDAVDGGVNNNGPRWFNAGGIFGVVDHCQFLAQTANGMGNADADKDNGPSTVYLYHHPFAFGDANAVYIENCFFYSTRQTQGNSAIDNYISRYVFRFNTVINNNIGHHGFDSQSRGVPTFEAYGNTFIANTDTTGVAGTSPLFIPRSGTGIVWGNVVKNMTGTTHAFSDFFTPQYYRAVRIAEMVNGNGGFPDAPAASFPNTPWSSYSGMHANFVGTESLGYGVAKTIDGNQFGNNNMDATLSRTVTDLNTTSGSVIVSSASATFVTGCTATTDLCKYIVGSMFKAGRESSCTISGTTLTCASETFDAFDVGRYLITANRNAFGGPAYTHILSVSSASVATLAASVSGAAPACSPCLVQLAEPFIVSVDSTTQVHMSVPANTSTTTGTLTIGFTNQGYPLLDQPGRGYFATANSGSWPNSASYTDANYEQLMPIYLFGNLWQTVDANLVVSVSANPPATTNYFVSDTGYVKNGRDFQDPAGGLQTTTTAPFDGTLGTGIGTLANRPSTCTIGVGYWAVDVGNWNTANVKYIYPNGGSAYTQGTLYQCSATNTWTVYYTPYTYPHPLDVIVAPAGGPGQ